MDMQETFDKVYTHLLQQGERSSEGDMCLYRGPNGLKCAVGCLISDEAYSPDLEGRWSFAVSVKVALEKSGVPSDTSTRRMLEDLQDLHDDRDPSYWKEGLERIASGCLYVGCVAPKDWTLGGA